MRLTRFPISAVVAFLLVPTSHGRAADEKATVQETTLEGPNGLAIKVRMEGPYTADVPLQVVCYFKYTPEIAKRMEGAPVELDKKLGGVIASLRERGEFVGDAGETLLLTPPSGSIPTKALLLVGLGDEGSFSLEVMEWVGRVSLREASRLSVGRVAFAPLVRDQGNSKFGTGEVASAVLRGALLAHDTENRLQKQGLAKQSSITEWMYEAGPKFFDETVAAARTALQESATAIARRPLGPYGDGSRK